MAAMQRPVDSDAPDVLHKRETHGWLANPREAALSREKADRRNLL